MYKMKILIYANNLHDEIVEIINLGADNKKKEVKIVNNPNREEMVTLFKEYMVVFARSCKDIPSLDLIMVAHRIPLLEGMELKE